MTEPTTLAKVIGDAFNEYAGELRVCLPGRIEKYDTETHLASVQPLIKRKFFGRKTSTLLPIVNRVPVMHPRTSSALLRLPVARGDIVALVFVDRSLEAWLQGDGIETDTLDTRQHHLSDAYAILGGYPQGNKFSTANPNALEIQVKPGTKIGIGNGEDELIAIAFEAFSNLSTLASGLSLTLAAIQSITHTETGTITGPPLNAATFATLKTAVDNTKTAIDAEVTKLGNIKI